jgi:hypothetical protein
LKGVNGLLDLVAFFSQVVEYCLDVHGRDCSKPGAGQLLSWCGLKLLFYVPLDLSISGYYFVLHFDPRKRDQSIARVFTEISEDSILVLDSGQVAFFLDALLSRVVVGQLHRKPATIAA